MRTLLLKKIYLKMSSANWRLFSFGLNVLMVMCLLCDESLINFDELESVEIGDPSQ